MVATSAYREHLTLFVNGKRHSVDASASAKPFTTLLDWLRSIGLTGTKLGCGEGGCGACTVMVSSFDAARGEVRHASVNACLMPLCAADWCAITTVEGIGKSSAPHPVQSRLAELHGSQCGFCTPGIVMAIYALFRQHPEASVAHLEEHMDGNLCRCTGYRPIWDAAKSLTHDAPRGDTCGRFAKQPGGETAAEGHSCAGACAGPEGCGGGGCGGASGGGGGGGGGGCCGGGGGELPDIELLDATPTELVSSTAHKLSTAALATPYSATDAAAREPEFPAALRAAAALPLKLSSPDGGVTWWAPPDLASLLALYGALPGARLIAGNTEVGIEQRFKGVAETHLSTVKVAEGASEGSGLLHALRRSLRRSDPASQPTAGRDGAFARRRPRCHFRCR